jgi:predicted nucleotidyltransferase
MDIYKLKLTKLQNEIFRLLCIKAGTALSKREIAGCLKVSPTAVSKSLPLLEKEGLARVKAHPKARISSVQLNRDNPKVIWLKRTENLKLLMESGLVDFLRDGFPGCTIIVFGSYSLGEDTKESDIDIAVIGSKETETDLEKFEGMLERGITLHFYGSLKEIGRNLKSNILDGITLEGAVDL